jgi:hypothetical protein
MLLSGMVDKQARQIKQTRKPAGETNDVEGEGYMKKHRG